MLTTKVISTIYPGNVFWWGVHDAEKAVDLTHWPLECCHHVHSASRQFSRNFHDTKRKKSAMLQRHGNIASLVRSLTSGVAG